MNTRRYRLDRLAQHAEDAAHADAARLAETDRCQALAARDANGIAPIAPEALAALFASEPSAAWAALAQLTDAQLVNQAIEYTVYLERQGIDKKWIAVYDCWVSRIAARASLDPFLIDYVRGGSFMVTFDDGRAPLVGFRDIPSAYAAARVAVFGEWAAQAA